MADTTHRIYTTSVASVYVHYVAKAQRKGRTKAEVDEILRWLTGYDQPLLEAHLEQGTNFENFFAQAPRREASLRAPSAVFGYKTSNTR